MSRDRVLAWVGGLGLLALHLDFWRPQRAVLWLDAIPEELGYRIVWFVLAGLYLAWFCGRFFREESAE